MLQPSGYMKVSSYANVKPSKTGATAIRRYGVWCGGEGSGCREGGWREGRVEGRGVEGREWREGSGGKGGVGKEGGGDKGVGCSMQVASGSVAMMSNRGRRVLQLFVLFGQPAAVAVRPAAAAHCLQCTRSS